MPQQYDTGLASPQRTLLRNGVITKLGPLLKANGLYLTAIEPIARMYKGAGDEEGLGLIQRALQGRAPAILVALGKATDHASGMSDDVGRAEVDLGVYVVSLHSRDMETGRLTTDVVGAADVTADPGIETMLEHVHQLLEKQDLGVATIYEPRRKSEDEVFTGADFTIWEQVYGVLVDVDIKPFRARPIVTSFETKHTQPDANDPIPNPANPIIDHITPLGAP
jgi:hypothetical protein